MLPGILKHGRVQICTDIVTETTATTVASVTLKIKLNTILLQSYGQLLECKTVGNTLLLSILIYDIITPLTIQPLGSMQ